MTALQYDVFVTPPIQQYSGTLNLPSGEPIGWSPIATTLIYGERDAVLVDPPFTTDTTRDVLTWVQRIGRNLTDIYITHGHGDHWFGAPVLLERFPDAVVRATTGTKAHMTSPDLPDSRASFWDALFPDQIPTTPIDVQVVDAQGFSLESDRSSRSRPATATATTPPCSGYRAWNWPSQATSSTTACTWHSQKPPAQAATPGGAPSTRWKRSERRTW